MLFSNRSSITNFVVSSMRNVILSMTGQSMVIANKLNKLQSTVALPSDLQTLLIPRRPI